MKTFKENLKKQQIPEGRVRRIVRLCLRLARIGCVLLFLCAAAVVLAGVNESVFPADVLVVPGNQVYIDGTPSQRLAARLDRAADLFRQGVAPRIIVSGGRGKNGVDEATAMKRYLVAQGLPAEALIVDSDGVTTRETGRFTAKYMAEHNLHAALAVTQYFHVPRTALALRQGGVEKVGGAYARYLEWRDLYSILREVPACALYFIEVK